MECRSFFHDPDISLPVVRRRAAEYLIDFVAWYGDIMLTNGKSLGWSRTFPSRHAYYNAKRRLAKNGLIAYRRRGDNEPVLTLTEEGDRRLSDAYRPKHFWQKKWKGIWYVLMYDVPERQRSVRDALRGFLVRLRMGCLQKSVWVSPYDIRPEYDDLVKTAGIDWVAFLFEAQTVLGQGAESVVEAAWNFERLGIIQDRYLRTYTDNLIAIQAPALSCEELQDIAREEAEAYLSAMAEDPLLPQVLHPPYYRGPKVFDLHRRFIAAMRRELKRRA